MNTDFTHAGGCPAESITLHLPRGGPFLCVGRDLIYGRLWGTGPGLRLSRRPLRFSERHGYTRTLPLPRGWRLARLKRGP